MLQVLLTESGSCCTRSFANKQTDMHYKMPCRSWDPTVPWRAECCSGVSRLALTWR